MSVGPIRLTAPPPKSPTSSGRAKVANWDTGKDRSGPVPPREDPSLESPGQRRPRSRGPGASPRQPARRTWRAAGHPGVGRTVEVLERLRGRGSGPPAGSRRRGTPRRWPTRGRDRRAPRHDRPGCRGAKAAASTSARRTSSTTWRKWLATPSPIRRPAGAVHQDEERRAGHLVVGPRVTRHDHRRPGAASAATSPAISRSGPLVTTTSRAAGGRPVPAGSRNDSQNPAHEEQPVERKASRVRPAGPGGATARASPPWGDPGHGRAPTWRPGRRQRRPHGEGHRHRPRPGLGGGSWAASPVGLADPRPQVVQGLQDVGVAAQQSGHQDGDQEHDDPEDDDRATTGDLQGGADDDSRHVPRRHDPL